MPYRRSNYEKGDPLSPKDGFWTQEEFRNNLSYYVQRKVLIKDFDMFAPRENNHVGLAGTKYNFYVKKWMFGYSIENGTWKTGKKRFTMIYQTFESILEADDVPDDVKDKLVFHIDFFQAISNRI